MKYQRLTKEQFEELHEEFATFLATQSIDAVKWAEIKENQASLAEEQLDLFSDMIWDRVLDNVTYVENIAASYMFLFKVEEEQMNALVIRILDDSIDVTTKEGFMWLKDNIMSDSVEIRRGGKTFSEDKKADLFALIQQGAQISNGVLYQAFDELLAS